MRSGSDGPLVVVSHLPGEGHFESDRFRVRPVECSGPFDYWRGLASAWDHPGALVNLEHDVAVTDEHIAALIDCPHSACSWVYRLHWRSSGVPGGRLSATVDDRPVLPGDEWATWSAIGLVKVTPAARIGPLRREPWQRVERAVADAVRGPWHLHTTPTLAHHHW